MSNPLSVRSVQSLWAALALLAVTPAALAHTEAGAASGLYAALLWQAPASL